MVDDLDAGNVRLSFRAVKDIGQENTKSGRITKDAAKFLAFEEQERMAKIFKMAEKVAEKEDRQTVKEDDIRLVFSIIEEGQNL